LKQDEDLLQLAEERVASFCEHGNEARGSIKREEFLYQLTEYYFSFGNVPQAGSG
jgi:hypothetical protein